MNERKGTGVPFDVENPAEKSAWDSLGDIGFEEPSPRLRQGFYHRLERASRPALWERLGLMLGFARPAGWLTAAGFAATGVLVGLLVSAPADDDTERLAALETSVASLNRTLVLDRIENESPTKRLRGVMDAVALVDSDPEVARALLGIAAGDRVYAVRSAAIDALGPELGQSSVADEIMRMLDANDSPHVQLALIDLVLRYGTDSQVERLVELAEGDGLYPALATHVLNATGSEIT